MKKYEQPHVALIAFDVRDVLTVSVPDATSSGMPGELPGDDFE